MPQRLHFQDKNLEPITKILTFMTKLLRVYHFISSSNVTFLIKAYNTILFIINN